MTGSKYITPNSEGRAAIGTVPRFGVGLYTPAVSRASSAHVVPDISTFSDNNNFPCVDMIFVSPTRVSHTTNHPSQNPLPQVSPAAAPATDEGVVRPSLQRDERRNSSRFKHLGALVLVNIMFGTLRELKYIVWGIVCSPAESVESASSQPAMFNPHTSNLDAFHYLKWMNRWGQFVKFVGMTNS